MQLQPPSVWAHSNLWFAAGFVFLLVGALCAQQSKAAPAPVQIVNFTDVAEKAGLTAQNIFGGVDTKKYIIETTGNGVAIFDYDNDGWPDIFLVNGTKLEGFPAGKGPTSRLYRNNHDGTFTDVTEKSGLNATGWGQGVCVGDYDNDGWEDLYVTYYGKNRLYHNDHGVFTEVGEKSGVAGSGKDWGTGCAFVDYDRDGRLDLVVANYVDFDLSTAPSPGDRPTCFWKGVPVMCGPRGLAGSRNILYHNHGDGTFEDVSTKAHILRTDGHYAFSVSTFDFDEDGWPDIYIACDSTPAILYRNNHDGTFTDVAVTAGLGHDVPRHRQRRLARSSAGERSCVPGSGLAAFGQQLQRTAHSLPQQRRWNVHRHLGVSGCGYHNSSVVARPGSRRFVERWANLGRDQ